VVLTARRTLLGTVPAGLSTGTYRLVVADPAGRTGALERAYRVVSAAVASFDVVLDSAPKASVPVPVTVIALDAGGAVVEGFTGSVTLADSAGALSSRSFGPFVLGHGRGSVAIPALASDTLTVSDGAGHTGTSAAFDVTAGPPMVVAFASAAVTVAAGACSTRVDLALRDGSGAATVADTAVAVALQSAPPGLALYSDAGCTQPVTSLGIPAGAGGASFHFRAAAAGPVVVRALPAALPNAVQTETVTP
jgi:hypothetical protein